MKMTLDNLAAIIAERFKIDPAKVTLKAGFEELGFDSLSIVDLAVLLEKKMGVRLSDEQLNDMANIGDILNALNAVALA